ncbi:alpha-amylase family protein (plasmid) [Halorussus limi]|uniref:Alpha-amylase family protein n=1 Tax=Halorussus limi TaxID=2938695 RepID=A0A8U0HZT1_9EURY|nr:alpha-amylase family protein [Halorussus limi]UPV76303.1 alpha-amylase family protein [Halorussus limi]
MGTKDRWYENATFYAIDVEAFADAEGDGVGDFGGLTDRLDYLHSLGIDCIWLLPFYPSPNRDNGYDVTDYYGVDDRHGTLGDFVEFVREADRRGIRVIIDLVVNHTSDQHPWFRRAREDPDSKHRDFYVWREDLPDEPDPHRGPVFPGEEDNVWSYDEEAEAFYYHRFYHYQPDLNLANPAVREEIRKIMGFWLELGVSGFRVDAATLMIDNKGGLESTKLDDPHGVLRDMRHFVERRGDDAILFAEADDAPEHLGDYFGGTTGRPASAAESSDELGEGDEMNVLLNFLLDAYLVLALAEREADPIREVLDLLPPTPEGGQWANFLRNYDELNVGRLSAADQQTVFDQFAPDEEMRIYGRGIRRRLAPMLDGDGDRLRLAYSLLFSLPGAPLLVYGDEIGMGDDLDLPGRSAVRTPMQWSDERNAGFSTADPEDLVRPVVAGGEYGYESVNVADQRGDPDSLLQWFSRLTRLRSECPEIGNGDCEILDVDDHAVFAHRMTSDHGSVVAVHNLDETETAVSLELPGEPTRLFGEAAFERVDEGGAAFEGGEEGEDGSTEGVAVANTDGGSDDEGRDGSSEWRFELDRYGFCWMRVESGV